jgi:aminoglycoside phosphotransferase (APT) family kinase protein
MTMAPVNDIDVAMLASYLQGRIEGFRGPLRAERFKGGQSNPTYLLTDAAGQRYVLRKKPVGTLLPSAHAVDREYRVMKALEQTNVPVPSMYCFCDEAQVIGTPFYVMEFVEGRIFWDPALPELDASERRAMYDEMNRVVATLHKVDYQAVGLEGYGRPANFFERQIGRWTRQYQASATGTVDAMDRLIDWLPTHIPSGDETTIFHGDLRLDNMIFHPREPRVLAVLDWELSTLGHPLADFAYHALPWRLTSEQFRGMAEKKPLPEGIPSEEEYLRSYSRRTGRPVDQSDYEFCVVYSMFRLAAILQGILKRSLDGTASSAQALETGLKARGIAEMAWAQVTAHFSKGH